jgi:DNA-binding MarR family transcriptional regulator
MAEAKPTINPLFLREEDLRQGMELLFYAYRDFTSEADTMLAALALGRAHHRVLYFVGRNPGLTVSDLMHILRVTKQSLNRVLAELLRQQLVVQHPGRQDRRQRLLFLTAEGVNLEKRLFDVQRGRLMQAYRLAGAQAVEGFRQVLQGISTPLTDAPPPANPSLSLSSPLPLLRPHDR